MKFFEDITAILATDDEYKEETAIDYIFEKIDELMWAGDEAKSWPDIDEILKYATEHVSEYQTCIILSILTASLPVRSKLSYNKPLIEATANHHKMSDKYKKKLFSGL